MDVLGKKLSEKTEAAYRDITQGFKYPIKFLKMDPANSEDVARPVAMDTGKKEFIIKLDPGLSKKLFENALIRDVIYCQQMNEDAPQLLPLKRNDQDAEKIAMMISSVVMDIDVENKLKKYDMHLDDIDTMRMADLYEFLKSGQAQLNPKFYHVFTGLQIALLYFTTSNKENVDQIIETFYLSDPEATDEIDKYVDILKNYGVDDNRAMMRSMRRLAVACGMKDRTQIIYEGKVTRV